MANIRIKQKHALGREDARAKVEDVARDLKSRLKADYSWHGDSLQFKRSGASGSIDVGDDLVEINIKLGLALTPMKGMIEKEIQKNLLAALEGKGNTSA